MYFWLVISVAVVALWLAAGVVVGWWRQLFHWFVGLIALGGIGLVAGVVLFTFGPFWSVVYATLLQPG